MDPELERKRKELERRLAKDKLRFPILIAVLIGASLIIGIVALQFPGGSRNWAIVVGIGMVIALSFAISRLFPGVACTSCERTFDDNFGRYCPECGTDGLKMADPYTAECGNCKKHLAFTGKTGNGRRRLFKIRFCTNCGMSFGQRPL